MSNSRCIQLIEDTLDYEAGSANLMPGLATGPAIYASEEHSELLPLMRRNFIEEGDVELVRARSPSTLEWYLSFPPRLSTTFAGPLV